MASRLLVWFLLATAGVLAVAVAVLVTITVLNNKPATYPDFCEPLIIAHRGASGYVPEHTLGAYALAVTMEADYMEPDLVMTSDGHLIARHDNVLDITTDVSEHPEFASRYRTQTVDGRVLSGWFTEDFTLAEVKTLRAIERIPNIRPGNARMDQSEEIPTLQEIIDLAKGLEISLNRAIGIVPELKHSTHFKQLGLAMERPIVDIFHRNGYTSSDDPILIQSFEVNNLKELKTMTDIRLVQLFAGTNIVPPDQAIAGTGLTYGAMATAAGLLEVATYAAVAGPDKSFIIPRDADGRLGSPTTFVADAHAAGLEVHPYTFRAENVYLPLEFRTNDTSTDSIGDFAGELRVFFEAGVDGVFADQPDVPFRIRGTC